MVKEDGTGLVFPAQVAGGEVCSDVTEGGSSKQGIDNGVDDGVGVRVTGEAKFKGDRDATKHEWTVCGKCVNIVTKANTHGHVLYPCMKASARNRSSSVVILILVYAPGKITTGWPSCSIRVASSVTSPMAPGLWCAWCIKRKENTCWVLMAMSCEISRVAATSSVRTSWRVSLM